MSLLMSFKNKNSITSLFPPDLWSILPSTHTQVTTGDSPLLLSTWTGKTGKIRTSLIGNKTETGKTQHAPDNSKLKGPSTPSDSITVTATFTGGTFDLFKGMFVPNDHVTITVTNVILTDLPAILPITVSVKKRSARQSYGDGDGVVWC